MINYIKQTADDRERVEGEIDKYLEETKGFRTLAEGLDMSIFISLPGELKWDSYISDYSGKFLLSGGTLNDGGPKAIYYVIGKSADGCVLLAHPRADGTIDVIETRDEPVEFSFTEECPLRRLDKLIVSKNAITGKKTKVRGTGTRVINALKANGYIR